MLCHKNNEKKSKKEGERLRKVVQSFLVFVQSSPKITRHFQEDFIIHF